MENTVRINKTIYQVEKVETEGTNRPAYILNGPRGAVYGAIRNINKPHKLFLINLRKPVTTMNIWLDDSNGLIQSSF